MSDINRYGNVNGGIESDRPHQDSQLATRIEGIGQDLGYALRAVRTQPRFALIVAVTLGLGLGANTVMYSVIDSLLFRPPALMQAPARTHRLYLNVPFRGREIHTNYTSYRRYEDLAAASTSFARLALFAEEHLAIGKGLASAEQPVGIVTSSFFDFYGAPPAVGRYFSAQEDRPPAGTAVAVLGYSYWRSAFAGRPDAVGQVIQIGATSYQIIGIAPANFDGMWPMLPPVAYIPLAAHGGELAFTDLNLRDREWWSSYHIAFAQLLAERKPGVSAESAQADLTRAYERSAAAEAAIDHVPLPATAERPYMTLESVLAERGPNRSSVTRVATWVAGVAALVWLIACANVANLLLVRSLRRRREIAVRLALGISRSRLASHLLLESLVLALLGGGVGALIATWGGGILYDRLLPSASAREIVADPRAFVFAGLAAAVTGLLVGIAPVLYSRRANLTVDLKTGAREGSGKRSVARLGLLITQGALSTVLLVGAGLFVRSLRNVDDLRLGYDPQQVLSVDLVMRDVSLDSARAASLRDLLATEARTIPGVVAAGRRVTLPFGTFWSPDIAVPGVDSIHRLGNFYANAVGPGYFAAMGTRLLQGRGISESDVAGAPRAVVVSKSMAQLFWPRRAAIGQCLQVGGAAAPCAYVVGVAEDVRTQNLSDEADLFFYVATAQYRASAGGLVVRMRGNAAGSMALVRRRLQALMPGLSYVSVNPLSANLGAETQSWRLGATLFTIFGGLALVVASIGLYSVIAYSIAQRMREMSVRVALGADMRDLVRLVLREGLTLAAVGVAAGALVALAVGPWLKPLLFDVSPRDPLVFTGVALVLVAVSILASLVPARRAGRVDPMQALRTE